MTFGSPHQGVFGVPECQAWVGDPVLGPALCELVRRLLNMGAYIPWIQVTTPLGTVRVKLCSVLRSKIPC